MECTHENLAIQADVRRDESAFIRLSLTCSDCSMPFRFVGLTPGISSSEPHCSGDLLQARLPIEPDQAGAATLRCPECHHLLSGEGLSRNVVIMSVDCGPSHRIRWSDNRVVDVGPGGVVVVSAGNDAQTSIDEPPNLDPS